MPHHGIYRITAITGLLIAATIARGTAPPPTGDATTQPASQPADVPDESMRQTFPLFGFSIIPPAYWTEMQADRPARAALWSLDDPQSGRTLALIGIEAGPSGNRPARYLAEASSRDGGHIAAIKRMDLDGVEGYECPVSSRERSMNTRAVRAIICVRNGLMYYIEASEAGGASTTPVLETLAKTWKWIPFETPVQHLGFRDAPCGLTSTVEISTPDVLRPPPPDQIGHGNPTLMAYDVLHARIDFGLDFKIIPRQAGEDYPTAARRMSQEISYIFSADPGIALATRDGTPVRMASQFVNAKMPGDKHAVRARFVFVDLGDDGVGVLRFMLPPNLAEASRKAYEATSDKMIDSLRPREPGAEDLPKPPEKAKAGKGQ